MNIIERGINAATPYVIAAAVGIVVIPIAPVVSAIAIPIFAISSFCDWIDHRALYNQTLTNSTREKFGRISGQNYTRWDGKAVQINNPPTRSERMHEELGFYVHGSQTDPTGAIDSPFKTQKDLEWLNVEFKRRKAKDRLDSDLKMLRAFSKALIPIIGIIWVLRTELGSDGASRIGCVVCELGLDPFDTHWSWDEAIEFHQRNLRRKLNIA